MKPLLTALLPSILPGESLVALALLTLLTGCQEGSGRLATQPELRPPEPVPAPVIRFEPRGYANSWEAVGVVGTTLTDHTFGVFAHDGNSTVSGLQVVWAVSGSGGSVTPTDDRTRDGASVATLTLGPEEGKYTVTASAPTLPGAPQLRFMATAVTLMVAVRDLADGGFVPASVIVPPGRSIGWRWDSGEGDVHDVVFEDDPTPPVSSGLLWNLWVGSRYHSRVFEGSPRTIRYRCTYHSTGFVDGEVGVVIVK